jgi:hypothetical protein
VKKFYDNYQDPKGDAIEGAFVTVLNPNGTLSSLFSANSPTAAPLSNPVVTDELGYYWFYVEDGRYNIRFNKVGYIEQTLTDVEIADIETETAVLDARIQAALARLNLSTGATGAAGPGVPPGGTAGQIVKKLTNANYDTVWANESVASGFRPEVALIPDATTGIAQMDSAASNNFLLTLARDVVIANPTGYAAGDRIRLILQQDSLGSHNISFGSAFQYSGNVTPAFTKAAGAIYRLDLDLIAGNRWVITPFIIQYNGDATPPSSGAGGVTDTLVTVYPWDGVIVIPSATLDSTTLTEYRAAIANAALGSKRAAGLAALRTAMGATQLLTVKRDGVTIFTANYTGQMTNVTIGSDLGLGLSLLADVSPVVAASISTGTWIATLATSSRLITAEVGPVGSGKMIILNADTTVGMGIIPSFTFIAPRSIDGLL